ncbi:hypothetical protein MMC25_000312 [Agyrium rufum]|nr:hypothetical protein [Agyrium rufum]
MAVKSDRPNDRRVLLIAGSDSSGGAGLEADQKVTAVHGCYAMTATTALTAQNTQGVEDIHVTPPTFVKKQIDACINDIGVDVVKIGMLASASTVEVVIDCLENHGRPTCVIDPVMMSTTGHQLLPPDAVRSFRALLPLATILTPNIPEAGLLLEGAGKSMPEVQTVNDLTSLAKSLLSLGPKWVLLKGGHLPLTRQYVVAMNDAEKAFVVDILVSQDNTTVLRSDWSKSRNTHGTGCSLASAIASNLATGNTIVDSVRKACQYVNAGIRLSIARGTGSGPINHFHSSYMLPFPPDCFFDYLISQSESTWREYTHHDFVLRLANGTLALPRFKNFLIQDYLFLAQFSRALALSASKLSRIKDIAKGARQISVMEHEVEMHIEYCKGFGISREEMELASPSQACLAYTGYVLDIGHSQDWFALRVSLAPCTIGYGMIGRRLYDDEATVRGDANPYWQWIESYKSQEYDDAVTAAKGS